MQDAALIERIRQKFKALAAVMDERMRRQWAAAEAVSLGWGGVSTVAVATGMARNTVDVGIREIHARTRGRDKAVITKRIRRVGAGRKPILQSDPSILEALERLVEPLTRGDPEAPLRWTCKSTRKLAEELQDQGHLVGERTVAMLLHRAGYSLQSNRKVREGDSHPDRNAQFEHINAAVVAFQRRDQPVISVDTKKKELVGDFRNGGREWRPQGEPDEVRVHDFQDPALGKAIPYGVYDVTNNQGWVSVGIDHDTAKFAAEAIRRWWRKMGAKRFPNANKLLITADGGGSNGSRCRLWKVALQDLADKTGLELSVCHFPPGTSKWNKIEHRLFCHITQNWRGKPLISHEVIVNLIANTTTRTGLTIKAELDTRQYETGIKVSDAELSALRLKKARFHGDWNYSISPR
ncbi:MAG TPA: ISAzo13 family transposase [Thermoanaerobaculaceae bacterium]|nr:ISAzo13 family transposase [Thermoanaerobaculaceae bacterium]